MKNKNKRKYYLIVVITSVLLIGIYYLFFRWNEKLDFIPGVIGILLGFALVIVEVEFSRK